MVVSHDPSSRKHFHLRGLHLWGLVFLLAALAFSSAFFFKRYEHANRRAQRLEQENRQLELTKRAPASDNVITPEERAQVEREIRAIYEKRDAAITSELNDLYDVEARLREKYELPPRVKVVPEAETGAKGGQGGAPSVFDADIFQHAGNIPRPAHLIYGLSRPSADLIVQEIRLRTESLEDLVGAMQAVQARDSVLSRTPALWPSVHPQARLSSSFGYRRDPFTGAIRHHDGLDVSAPSGTPVLATADGTVVFAGWDTYYGNLVKIDHGNNLETWYAHMRKLGVHSGQQVRRGDKLGTVGSTGRSTGAHIHYEVRLKDRPVDPGPYLGN